MWLLCHMIRHMICVCVGEIHVHGLYMYIPCVYCDKIRQHWPWLLYTMFVTQESMSFHKNCYLASLSRVIIIIIIYAITSSWNLHPYCFATECISVRHYLFSRLRHHGHTNDITCEYTVYIYRRSGFDCVVKLLRMALYKSDCDFNDCELPSGQYIINCIFFFLQFF